MKQLQTFFPESLRSGLVKVVILLVSASLPGCQNKTDDTERLRSEIRLLSNTVRQLEGRLAELEQHAASRVRETDESTQAILERSYTPGPAFSDDPFIGQKNAPVLVMVFSDFECRPCRMFHKTALKELREKYANDSRVQIVFRDFPLENTPRSIEAAALAHCAGENGGYWRMFDLLVENEKLVDAGEFERLAEDFQPALAPKLLECLRSKRYEKEVAADREDGIGLGAKGAPGTFVGHLADSGSYRGVFIRGAQPTALIEQQIRLLLREPK